MKDSIHCLRCQDFSHSERKQLTRATQQVIPYQQIPLRRLKLLSDLINIIDFYNEAF